MRQTESSRVLHSAWWIVVLVLIHSYSGTLIASLTAPRLVKVADSLDELTSQSEILWTVRRGSTHQTLFQMAHTGTYGRVGQLLRQHPSLLAASDSAGVDMVRSGRYAFIKEMSFLQFSIAADYDRLQRCNFGLASETFYKAKFSWIFQKGSPFTQVIDTRLLRYAQAGLFIKWQQQFFPLPNECTHPSPAVPRSLALSDLVGCFTILGGGLTLAGAVLCVQLLVTHLCPAHTPASHRG